MSLFLTVNKHWPCNMDKGSDVSRLAKPVQSQQQKRQSNNINIKLFESWIEPCSRFVKDHKF